jgi:hypothetical protein
MRAQDIAADATPSGIPGGLSGHPRAGPEQRGAEPGAIDPSALDAALIDAHHRDDRDALVRLYASAGDLAEAAGDVDACCFYLTHAYVFALQEGAPEADGLHARLLAYGREE